MHIYKVQLKNISKRERNKWVIRVVQVGKEALFKRLLCNNRTNKFKVITHNYKTWLKQNLNLNLLTNQL